MNNSSDSPKLFDIEVSPYRQCLITLLAIPGFIILYYIPHWLGWIDLPEHQAWTVSASMVLMFAVSNSVLSLGADDINSYWNKSILSFVMVCVIGGLIAWAVSGQTITEAKSFKWIYIVFSFGYLFFLSIVSLMRKVVMIAQKQDKRLRGESDDD